MQCQVAEVGEEGRREDFGGEGVLCLDLGGAVGLGCREVFRRGCVAEGCIVVRWGWGWGCEVDVGVVVGVGVGWGGLGEG
jgi:hypothetical protein